MEEILVPPLLDETGQAMKQSMDSNTEEMKKGLQAIADALNNTEAVKQAKQEIQAEGATQVASVQAAAQEIVGKVEQIQKNTDDLSILENTLLEKHESVNLFNENSELLVSGKYIQGSGDYKSLSGSHVSHPIKIKSGKSYTFNIASSYYGQNARTVRLCDENGVLDSLDRGLQASDNGDGSATFTYNYEDDGFVCVNVRTPSTMMFVEGTSLPVEYQPYYKSYVQIKKELLPDADNPIYGKKLYVDGDSIMYGAGSSGGFAKIIGDRNNMTVINNAVSGGTIASGTYHSDGETKRHWICESIKNAPEDSEYILFDGAVNDSSETAEVGTISSGFYAELDTTTFCGAMESICKWLVINRPNAKIGYVIVHKMASNYTSEYPSDGNRDLYRLAIKICEKWGIPYKDLNTQVPPLKDIQSLRDVYTSNADGWHPNELGYNTYYVPKIEAWMKTL